MDVADNSLAVCTAFVLMDNKINVFTDCHKDNLVKGFYFASLLSIFIL